MDEINQIIFLKCILKTYILSDNPTTCSFCGSRTFFINTFMHQGSHIELHQCNQVDCLNTFLVEEDDLFNGDYWADEARV